MSDKQILSLLKQGKSMLSSGEVGIIAICLNIDRSEIWCYDYFQQRTGKILTQQIIESCYVEQDSIETDSNFKIQLLPEVS